MRRTKINDIGQKAWRWATSTGSESSICLMTQQRLKAAKHIPELGLNIQLHFYIHCSFGNSATQRKKNLS